MVDICCLEPVKSSAPMSLIKPNSTDEDTSRSHIEKSVGGVGCGINRGCDRYPTATATQSSTGSCGTSMRSQNGKD